MLLLLFLIEYFSGIVAFYAFDAVLYGFDLFVFYFFALMAIEAMACDFALSLKIKSSKLYAALNMVAIPVHFYGLSVFVLVLDRGIYESALVALLIAKLMTAVSEDGIRNSIHGSINAIRGSIYSSNTFLFITKICKGKKWA